MTVEQLKTISKEQIYDFIRDRLKFDEGVLNSFRNTDHDILEKQHKRFDMTSRRYAAYNNSLLHLFDDLGIYGYVEYLFINFHEGLVYLHYQYSQNGKNYRLELTGEGTVDIIHRIFKLTILRYI